MIAFWLVIVTHLVNSMIRSSICVELVLGAQAPRTFCVTIQRVTRLRAKGQIALDRIHVCLRPLQPVCPLQVYGKRRKRFKHLGADQDSPTPAAGEHHRRAEMGRSSNACVVVAVVVLMAIAGCEAWDCSTTDRAILLAFKASFVDPNGLLQSWNSSSSNCCTWYGVTCRETDGAVLQLTIVGNSAPNTQPYLSTTTGASGISGLTGLAQLQKLTIQWVLFNEGIPSAWGGGFSTLQWLQINDANLRDDIPSNLANIQTLQHLDLKSNHLTGSIPSSFCSAPSLTYIDVSYNDMNYILVPACLQNQNNVTITYGGQGQSTSPGAPGAGSILTVATSAVLALGALSTAILFW